MVKLIRIPYSHLRVFACLAFSHISKKLRQKLDTRNTPCTFIGYEDEKFDYRLWDPEIKKVIRSRDIMFRENQSLEDIEKPTMSPNPKFSAQDIALNLAP